MITKHWNFFLFIHLIMVLAISCTTDVKDVDKKKKGAEIKAINHLAIQTGTEKVAIVHAKIIVGDGNTVIEDGSVLVSNSLIESVGRFDEVPIPENTAIIDASGMSLLPGLIDAHFHLDKMDSLPSLFLSRGITSLKDPGAWIEAYDKERNSERVLPRLFLTGPHIDMFPPAYPDNSFVVADGLEAKRAVNRFANQGASAIKIYFRSSLEIIRAACETAHQRSIPVSAHLEMTDIYEAVKAGIDGIEHITSLGTNLIPPKEAEAYKQAILKDNNARKVGRYAIWKNIDPEGLQAKQLGEFLADHKVVLCPTLGAFEYQPDSHLIDTTRLEGFQNMMRYTKKLHEMGMPIVVGSHSWVRYSEYGWAYHHEMELLEKAGISQQEIIRSATSANTQFLGVGERLGTIENGKIADLILVEGNPLVEIKQLRNVRKVMQAGHWVSIQ